MSLTAAALFIYPVKSAAGISCDTVELAEAGFRHDREWMVVDPAGRFLTQRELPQLSQLRTRITSDELQLTGPAGGRFLPWSTRQRVEVQVWAALPSFDAGAESAAFLGDFLQRPVRLVRFDPAGRRLSNHDWTGGRDVATRFTDGYPLLVLSQASIDDLSARVGRTLEPLRFRPNLLVGGAAAYDEDAAQRLHIGAATFALTKASTPVSSRRWILPTVRDLTMSDGDPQALRHDAALRAWCLAAMRRRSQVWARSCRAADPYLEVVMIERQIERCCLPAADPSHRFTWGSRWRCWCSHQVFQELYHSLTHVLILSEAEVVLALLALVDLSLVASLIVMVMFSGYESFVSKIDMESEGEKLGWLGKLDAGTLKLKVAASIVAISSIHLLRAFVDAEEIANDKLMWYVIIHLTFVVSAVLLGVLDKLTASTHRHDPRGKD